MPRAKPTPGPSRGLFDAWSRIYDVPLVQLATYRPVHNAVMRALGAQRPMRVLDVGCGTGQLARRIAKSLDEVDVVGCDFSSGMLGRAAAHLTPVRWVRGDAGRLPFPNAIFEAVVSTEAFHWFPDQSAVLEEIHRVLTPDGRLLLALVNPPIELVGDVFYAASRRIGEPFRWPTPRQLRAQLEAAGFEVGRQRRIFRISGFLLPPTLTVACKRRPPAGRRR